MMRERSMELCFQRDQENRNSINRLKIKSLNGCGQLQQSEFTKLINEREMEIKDYRETCRLDYMTKILEKTNCTTLRCMEGVCVQ